MIHIDLDPVLIYLGPITIRWFHLAVGFGLLVTTVIAGRWARNVGLSPTHMYWLAVWGLLFGVPIGRLVNLTDHWAHPIGSLRSILSFDIVTGVDYLGAMLGALLAGYVYCRIRAISTMLVASALAPALLLGQVVGLLGAVISGDGAGNATILPWGLVYDHPAASLPSYLLGTPVHPLAVYQIVAWMVVWAIGVTMPKRMPPRPALFAAYLCLTAIIYPLWWLLRPGGMQTSLKLAPLICALILFCLGVALLRWRFKVASRLDLETAH